MDVRVGIDFGTHQTKVCVNYKKENQPQVFEFIDFGDGDVVDFFLPSQLNILSDKTISVGYEERRTLNSYRYFKIVSAEDKEFKKVSGYNTHDTLYDINRYGELKPELISIIYLTHVIGMVKKNFTSRHKTKKKTVKKKSFFGKFFGGYKDDSDSSKSKDFNFFYQIGIPTEWSAKKNRWRRRKFEQILYIALDILEEYPYEKIKELKLSKVEAIIAKHYQELQNTINNKSWGELLKDYEISAFPETAAGLTYLVKTEQISEGYYIALDIGGGSSDVSFFRVNNNRTFEYLASESLLIASNNLFDHYMKISGKFSSTEETQEYLEQQSKEALNIDEKYLAAFDKTIKKLNSRIKKIYNRRVYFRFRETIANKKFKNQSCFLYGGGSLLHIPERNSKHHLKEILLHDNGTQSLRATRTFAEVEKIKDFDLNQKVKPEGWKDYLPLLIVPLGLSFIQPDQTYDWNDSFYEPGEGHFEIDIDEDPGIFDIKRRRWV